MRKFTAILLSVLMVLMLISACSSGETNENIKTATGDNAAQETTAGGESSAVKEDGPLTPYDPRITIKSHLSTIDATIKFTDTETPEDNVWTRAYQEQLGIKLEYQWTGNMEQGREKMNLAIASDDLPELFWVDRNQFEQLLQAGKLADLTDAYNKYAGPFMRDVMTRPGAEQAMKAVSRDGHMYAIPYFLNMTDDTKNIYIRTDWLKKLGLPEPKTMQDVLNIAQAFTTGDPDGNKKDDTYGFPMHKDSFTYGGMATFFNGFHAYPGIWVKDANGKLVSGVAQADRMKLGFAELNKLYNSKVIQKGFGALDWGSNIVEDMMNNRVGVVFGNLWDGWWPLGEMKVADPEVEWKSYPVLSIDSDPAKAQSVPAMFMRLNVVRADFKSPEAVVKMANLTNKLMWESDAETFAKYGYDAAGNNPWLLTPVYFEAPGKNHSLHLKTSAALADGDTSKLNGEDSLIYGWMKNYLDGDMSRYGIYLSYGPDSSCAKMEYYLKNNLYMLDEFYGNPTQSLIDKNAILEKLFQEYAYKIVIGELPVDAYDKFVEEWYSQGGEDITKEVNSWYDANK